MDLRLGFLTINRFSLSSFKISSQIKSLATSFEYNMVLCYIECGTYIPAKKYSKA